MPRKSDAIRVKHLLDAAREAVEFAEGHTWEDFQQNRLVQLSVLHSIMVIGEAGANTTAEYQAKHPEFLGKILLASGIALFMRNSKLM